MHLFVQQRQQVVPQHELIGGQEIAGEPSRVGDGDAFERDALEQRGVDLVDFDISPERLSRGGQHALFELRRLQVTVGIPQHADRHYDEQEHNRAQYNQKLLYDRFSMNSTLVSGCASNRIPRANNMHRVFAIFNPAARGEKSQRLSQFLESKAVGDSGLTLAQTRGPGDARPLAMQAVADGYEIVVAAGGDGTINEVVNGIGRSGVALGVVPLGTANVFARELGIPLDFAGAWAVIERGRTRVIDLPLARFGGAERYFVQLAGVGLDAAVVRAASWGLKKRIGPLSYIWAGLKTVSREHALVEVGLENATPRARGMAVLIGNGRFYGGPFKLFPEAKLDDGRLDVCVFENVGHLNVLRYAQAALRGAHTRLRDVQYFQADQFVCRVASPDSDAGAAAVPFELDGEDVGQAPVRFSVLPHALRVVVP